jgi:hypothetical protein
VTPGDGCRAWPMSFVPGGGLPIDDLSNGAMTMKLTASMTVTLDDVHR